MKKIAINGFGRIGRMAARAIFERKINLQIAAINDPSPVETLAHLLEFDSTFGKFGAEISFGENFLKIGKTEIPVFAERDPQNLPWKDLKIDTVLECTGIFRTRETAAKHLSAGAKRVVISAPAKDKVDATFVLGVNENEFDPDRHKIISNASCTTNCLAPIAKVLHENFKIKNGLMTTTHAYTGDQKLLDAAHPDLRRARAAALSMIPTTTGAARAVALVLPDLTGKLNGMAVRVPTPTVSLVDLTVELERTTDAAQINHKLKLAAEREMAGILGFEERPLVSCDFKMDSRSSIVDAASTLVAGGNLAKVLAWYDNEWGYSNRLVELAELVSK